MDTFTIMQTETPKMPEMMPRNSRTADAEQKKQKDVQSKMSLLSCSFKTGSRIFHLSQFLFKGLCLTILALQVKVRG